MRKTFTLRRGKDGVVTFKYGSYVEHIDVSNKGLMDTYESIKWAAITAGLPLNEATLDQLMREAKGLQPS